MWLVVLLACVVYLPALGNGWAMDDEKPTMTVHTRNDSHPGMDRIHYSIMDDA